MWASSEQSQQHNHRREKVIEREGVCVCGIYVNRVSVSVSLYVSESIFIRKRGIM